MGALERIQPTVVSVQVSNKHVFSKFAVEHITLIENHGVEGDSHAGATDQHLYHISRYGHQPNLRQVHLIQAELFDQLDQHGHQVRPGDLGENISTRDVDLLGLPTGARLHLGATAVVELTGLRNPCRQIEDFQVGLLQHMTDHRPAGVVRKAGVMGIVVTGGQVRPSDPIVIELPTGPHAPLIYRTPVLDLRISSVRREAENIRSVELRAADNGVLPTFTAGAHIDLKLIPGLTRSYSLTNDPAETDRYVIFVDKDPASRGGSRHVHEQLRVHDRLEVSPPRNNFELFEAAAHTVLVCGGIGITPMRAMIHTLEHLGRSWELFYASRNRQSTAFLEELQVYEEQEPGRVNIHINTESNGARMDLGAIVAAAPEGSHFYCCGPTRMIEDFDAVTAVLPASSVHTERFTSKTEPATKGGFSVTLRRSQRTLEVHVNNSILDTLLAAGVGVPYSCKEGTCGSCAVRVLEGTPDHRDSFLSPSEQQRNDHIMVCCSGSHSPSLLLDL